MRTVDGAAAWRPAFIEIWLVLRPVAVGPTASAIGWRVVEGAWLRATIAIVRLVAAVALRPKLATIIEAAACGRRGRRPASAKLPIKRRLAAAKWLAVWKAAADIARRLVEILRAAATVWRVEVTVRRSSLIGATVAVGSLIWIWLSAVEVCERRVVVRRAAVEVGLRLATIKAGLRLIAIEARLLLLVAIEAGLRLMIAVKAWRRLTSIEVGRVAAAIWAAKRIRLWTASSVGIEATALRIVEIGIRSAAVVWLRPAVEAGVLWSVEAGLLLLTAAWPLRSASRVRAASTVVALTRRPVERLLRRAAIGFVAIAELEAAVWTVESVGWRAAVEICRARRLLERLQRLLTVGRRHLLAWRLLWLLRIRGARRELLITAVGLNKATAAGEEARAEARRGGTARKCAVQIA